VVSSIVTLAEVGVILFDHDIGGDQQGWRHGQSEGLRRF
jgi:hypothetical protein